MEIYLVRHGHYLPDQGSSDGPLTEKGKLQVRRLANRFVRENINFRNVYSSSLDRAIESAKICSGVLGIKGLAISGLLDEEKN